MDDEKKGYHVLKQDAASSGYSLPPRVEISGGGGCPGFGLSEFVASVYRDMGKSAWHDIYGMAPPAEPEDTRTWRQKPPLL